MSIKIKPADSHYKRGTNGGQVTSSLESELSKASPIPSTPRSMAIGIPADILNSRPDVRSAERLLALSTAKIGVAEAARYPSISLTGTITSQALSINDLAKNSTISWAIGPAVTIPLFQGGRLLASVEVAKASRDEAAANYQNAVLSALEDVQNAIVALNQNKKRNAKLFQAVRAYRKASEGAFERYEAGSSDYSVLLDAQRAHFQAESSYIESKLAVVQSYIALHKALGGGWSGSLAN